MGADSGQNKDSGQSLNDIIMISTETVESFAAGIIEYYASVRELYNPIPSSRETLTGKNTSGAMTSSLQKIYDAEVSFYKHMGQLETGAQTLRNIAITYDNAERTLLGEPERDLIEPTVPPGIEPYSPDPAKPDQDQPAEPHSQDPPKTDPASSEDTTEKKSSGSGWRWNKKQYQKENTDEYEWYNAAFDKYGKMSIGQKKKINAPKDGEGSYNNQENFSWTAGLTVFKYVQKEDMLKKYDWDQRKEVNPYQKTLLSRKGDDPFAPKKVGTFLELYVEYACSWTGLGAQAVKVKDSYKYAAEAYLARAQAKVHAGVGAFKYKTADGRMVQAYGLSVESGASFTIAGAAASGDLGYTWAGIMGSSAIAIGQIYTNANTTVGWVDGKFVAVVSGAVGADLFSASGSIGERWLGVEVQAGATFKVGVSARFEVGFDGSKFKYNIGISLGIGCETSFSFDFSKVGSALKDFGRVAVDAYEKSVELVREYGGTVVRSVTRFFRRW